MKSLFAINIKGEYNYHTLSMLHLRKSEMALKNMPALPEFYKRMLLATPFLNAFAFLVNILAIISLVHLYFNKF